MTVFSRAVTLVAQPVVLARMRAMLAPWARIAIGRDDRLPELAGGGMLRDLTLYRTALGPDGCKPLAADNIDIFMSLWARSGIGPGPLFMVALLTRDPGLACALCSRADLELGRPSTQRERVIVGAYGPNALMRVPRPTTGVPIPLDTFGSVLAALSHRLGHGAEDVLRAMRSMQEARDLSGFLGDGHPTRRRVIRM